jgi:hypothetical protein
MDIVLAFMPAVSQLAVLFKSHRISDYQNEIQHYTTSDQTKEFTFVEGMTMSK